MVENLSLFTSAKFLLSSKFDNLCTIPNDNAMQQILSNFRKFSDLHALISTWTFIRFWDLQAKNIIFSNKIPKVPACILINFRDFANLHLYFNLHYHSGD